MAEVLKTNNMPSKRGFGNTRKKGSAYRYGIDSKNPIMMGSPAKKVGSYIGGVQVSDIDADIKERQNIKKYGLDTPKEEKVTRTGKSLEKKILQERSEQEKQSGKKSRLTRDLIKETKPGGERSETREGELRQIELNKAKQKELTAARNKRAKK